MTEERLLDAGGLGRARVGASAGRGDRRAGQAQGLELVDHGVFAALPGHGIEAEVGGARCCWATSG